MALQLDGVRHIMAGIQQGAAIANMLRRAALDEEVMARDKARMERENQMHDIQLQKTLQSSGRPVEGNVVRDKVKMPGAEIPGMDPRVAQAIGVGDRLVEMARPVDKSRLMRTKLSDGREVAVEAFTQDELRERDLAERTAIGELLTKLKLGEVGQLREMGESPGAIAATNQTAANLRAAAGMLASDARNSDTLRSREQIAEDNRTFDATQKDLDRKSREKAAGMRGGGGSGVAERASQKRIDALQAEHDDMHAKEQALWAEVEAGKARIKEIDTALAGKGIDTKTRLDLSKERREIGGAVNSSTLKARALESQKKDRLKRKDALRGGTGEAQLEYVPGKGLVKR